MKIYHIPTIGLNNSKVCSNRVKKAFFTRLYSKQMIQNTSTLFIKKVAIATGFMVAVAWQNTKIVLSE